MNKFEIKISNITKIINGKIIFKNFCHEQKSNSLAILLGANGSGKTTLLKIIAGLFSTSSINGNTKDESEFGKIVSTFPQHIYCGHELGFYPNLSIQENLDFFSKLYNDKKSKEEHLNLVLNSLDKWDLSSLKNRNATDLSKGQQARLALAISFLPSDSLILLDEPEANLDSSTKQLLLDNISTYLELGSGFGSIIVATHNKNFYESLKITDKIIINL